MSKRSLVRLRDRYPTVSRMTQHRMKSLPGFPAGVDINGTEYFYEDELERYEQARRRFRPSAQERIPPDAAEAEVS